MHSDRIVDRSWLSRHPVEAAYRLLGNVLRVERDGVVTAGRIVECEAYAGPLDAASHTARLKVAQDVMSRDPGTVYTYISYGIHTMMNIVAHEPGERGAVLIRAIEPVEGIAVMRERRGDAADVQLGRGPGNACAALGVRMTDLGDDVMSSAVLSLHAGTPKGAIAGGPRIGISKAMRAPWRFFEMGSPCVSSHRRGAPMSLDEALATIPPAGTPVE